MQTTINTDGKAVNTKSTFSMACAISINISASPETIWELLSDTSKISDWNSTIISLSGEIALNQTINLKSTAAPERTFNLKVTTLNAPHKMVWEDGVAPMFKGVRTYTLTANDDGTTDFAMRENFSGVMLPMIKSSLPDFRPSFEQFASDLKQASEA